MLRLCGFGGGLWLATASLLFVPTAQAQLKVAVINFQKALSDTAELKKAQADLETKYKPRQDEIAKRNKELEDIRKQLETLGDRLTQQAQADLNMQGQRKQREIQRLSEDLQGDVEREKAEILNRISRQMQEVIDKLAADKSIDIVLAAGTTLFFKPSLDLTKEATEAYDKAHPAK